MGVAVILKQFSTSLKQVWWKLNTCDVHFQQSNRLHVILIVLWFQLWIVKWIYDLIPGHPLSLPMTDLASLHGISGVLIKCNILQNIKPLKKIRINLEFRWWADICSDVARKVLI